MIFNNYFTSEKLDVSVRVNLCSSLKQAAERSYVATGLAKSFSVSSL